MKTYYREVVVPIVIIEDGVTFERKIGDRVLTSEMRVVEGVEVVTILSTHWVTVPAAHFKNPEKAYGHQPLETILAKPTEPPSEKELSLKQKLGIDPVVDDRKALGHDYDSTGVGAAADDTERIEFLERQCPFRQRLSWGFVDDKGGITIRPASPGCDPKFSYATFREAVDAARLYFTPVPRKGAEKLSNVVNQSHEAAKESLRMMATPPPLPPQPASDIHGKVIRAGTFPVRDEEITGLVVQCSREELERAPNLMYAEVTVSTAAQPDSEPTDAELRERVRNEISSAKFYGSDTEFTTARIMEAIRAAMSKGAK